MRVVANDQITVEIQHKTGVILARCSGFDDEVELEARTQNTADAICQEDIL